MLGHLMRVFIQLYALELCECPGKEKQKKTRHDENDTKGKRRGNVIEKTKNPS